MINLDDWLNELGRDGQTPRHQRLCFLIMANGGLRVGGWGIICHDGSGHQRGLEQDDALELMQAVAFMMGLDAADVPVFERLKPYMDSYQAALDAVTGG